jgi:dipeptide/tripeptide permease
MDRTKMNIFSGITLIFAGVAFIATTNGGVGYGLLAVGIALIAIGAGRMRKNRNKE